MSVLPWRKPESLYTVVCRPALPKDTADVMDLTRDIWDGDDYVPHVWHDWLADPVGLLAAAEYGGRVVGVGKLTRLAPGQWWMEGLRVHPSYQERGIARHLHNYLVADWEQNYGGVLRLATSSKREAVHHLCETTGFHKLKEYTNFFGKVAKRGGGSAEAFRLLELSEVPAALAHATGSETLRRMGGVMDMSWSYAKPDVFLLEKAVREQRAWWWRERSGLLVAWDEDEAYEGQTISYLGLPGCALQDLASFLQDFQALTARRGFDVAGWIAPLERDLQNILTGIGFERVWEGSLYIFERREAGS